MKTITMMKRMIRNRLGYAEYAATAAAAAASSVDGSRSKSQRSICGICGKGFMSVKALHGHMRCHPERDWRGMLPPLPKHISTAPSSTSSAPTLSASNATFPTDHDDHHRQTQRQSLRSGWTVKAKRGRKSSIQASCSSAHSTLSNSADSTTSAAAELTEEEEDAIISLLQFEANTSLPSKKPRFAGQDLSAPLPNNSTASFGILCPEDYNPVQRELLLRLDQTKCNSIFVLGSGQEREKISNEDERKPKIAALNSHRCDICKKAFNSHQVLGRHKSSHFHKAKSAKAEESVMKVGLGLIPRLGGNSHQCKVCNRSFESGQKLGGHMRCHWTPPAPIAAAAEAMPHAFVAASTAAAAAEKKLLGFDLNELPDSDSDADAKELRPQLTLQLLAP
ncbi:hypothetical protein Ancab_024844 [Ancistrocladus abbreviatus]